MRFFPTVNRNRKMMAYPTVILTLPVSYPVLPRNGTSAGEREREEGGRYNVRARGSRRRENSTNHNQYIATYS